MASVSLEQQKSNYVETNQSKIREDLYQNIVDPLMQANVNDRELRKQVILPSVHIGSPRDVHSRFQGAMATINEYGQPHLFIIMT